MTDLPSYDQTEFSQKYLTRIGEAFGIHLRHKPVERWMSWRGHQIHVDEWQPAAAHPRGTIVLVHGGGGNGRLLAPFASPLVEENFCVFAPDLPGYGLTIERPRSRPNYADWVDLVSDLAVEAHRNGPVFTYGLSVGGMTALRAAQRAPDAISGVVATTLIDLRDPEMVVGGARNRLLGHAAVYGARYVPWLIDRVALPLAFTTPIETLTTDPELARLFLRDPL